MDLNTGLETKRVERIELSSEAWKAAALPLSYTRAPAFSLLKERSAIADANHVTEAATEGREEFAAALDAGDELLLARADGPLVDATVLRIDGVDLDLRALAGDLAPGGLATIRLHDGESAWFATLIVLGAEPTTVARRWSRPASATRCASRRSAGRNASTWSRRPCCGPRSAPTRCCAPSRSTSRSPAWPCRVRERPPELGTRIGVVLAGDGDGSIAFRGRVTRSSRTSHGAVLGIEIVGISRDDHRRLQRAIGRRYEP